MQGYLHDVDVSGKVSSFRPLYSALLEGAAHSPGSHPTPDTRLKAGEGLEEGSPQMGQINLTTTNVLRVLEAQSERGWLSST